MRRKFLITTIPLLAATLATGCATPTQLVLDARVDRLCAEDGGVRVHERVQLPPAEYAKYISGTVSKSKAKPEDLYYYQSTWEILSGPTNGDPEGTTTNKSRLALIRASDGKMLGAYTAYYRIGGDVPLGFHPSSYRCPSAANADEVIKQGGLGPQVFLKSNGDNHVSR